MNAQQPYALYEALFGRPAGPLPAAGSAAWLPDIKNKLYAVDASTIDLCLAAFLVGVRFRRTKGAIKLHVGVRPGGTSADVHQRDRRQDRATSRWPVIVDVPGRQRE